VRLSFVIAVLAVTTVACGSEADVAPDKGMASPPSPPADETTKARIDLGDVLPGREVTFDVPAGTLGFNITVEGDANSQIGVESLVSPSGEKVVDGFFLPGANPDARMAVLGGRGASALSVPQSDGTATRPVEHGTWKVVASGIVPDETSSKNKSSAALPTGPRITTPLHVTVAIQRTSDGEFHGGELDLHVWMPAGLRAHDPDPIHEVTSPEGDRSIAKRIDLFYEDLESLFGIARGRVQFHSIDASFRSATSGDARAAACAQAEHDGSPALHVVLTNELSYGGGETILGYSGGIPGSALASRSARSAIVVALYENGTAANDALTVLHEMGHFVGLMHDVDYDGTVDLLADTPTKAVDNLMAPDGPKGAPLVSPSQMRIVRGSAIYRAKRVR
jgi:hypothetical protein